MRRRSAPQGNHRARQPEPSERPTGGGGTGLLVELERTAPDATEAPEGTETPEAPAEPAESAVPRIRTRPAGPPRPPEGEPNTPTAWWRRLASAAELLLIAVVLGIVFAAVIGLAVVALFGLLRGAVG